MCDKEIKECPYNVSVLQDANCTPEGCKRCGWNPKVAENRKKKLRQGKLCMFMSDDGQEICLKHNCPAVADFCPVAQIPGICKYEMR